MNRYLLATLAVVAAFSACKGAITSPAAPKGELTPVDMTNHPSMDPLPDPETNGGHAGRAPRRITVAQLKQSIQVTTGTQWTQIDNLAASLGQADFAVTSSESTEPNLVFAKFLEDGAREVCLRAATQDFTRAQSDRVLWPEIATSEAGTTGKDFTMVSDASVAKNLTYLSLRFWGQPMAADEVAQWAATFKAVAVKAKSINKPEQAWGAMCIALMTDPRFMTY